MAALVNQYTHQNLASWLRVEGTVYRGAASFCQSDSLSSALTGVFFQEVPNVSYEFSMAQHGDFLSFKTGIGREENLTD